MTVLREQMRAERSLAALEALQLGQPREAYDLLRYAAGLSKDYNEREYRKWAKK